MTSTRLLLPALLAVLLLSGCNFFHERFGRKEPPYQQATQARPLEVPPDLDQPSSSAALTIPAASARASSEVGASSSAPPMAASAASVAPAATIAPGATINAGDLQVTDTVSSTWKRVGLALERSGAASITGRDEAGYAYTVETTAQAVASDVGWFKKAITLGRAGKKTTVRVPLTVRVSADGAGSRVSIEGAGDKASEEAARSLLAALRQRLS